MSFPLPFFGAGRVVLLVLALLLLATRGRADNGPTSSLEFVENRGQWPSRVHYMAELPGGRLFLESRGFTYALADPEGLQQHQDHQRAPGKLRMHAYSVSFEGASSRPQLTGINATADRRNYFLGNDASRWARGVQAYRQVRYDNLYPGISTRLYENRSANLEYDFLLQPGARPAQIRLRYIGVDKLTVEDGQLRIRTSVGTVTELAPRAWQLQGDRQISVACAYELHGSVVSFRLGQYNPDLPLTIDPTVLFSSFTGSSADNWGFTATYDQQGNMYSGGIVFGTGFPVNTGAYDVAYNGTVDMAIIKYNTSATGLASRVYATYLGGDSTEAPHSLVVNAAGELVIMGSTSSRNYPTTPGAFDTSFNGGPRVTNVNALRYINGSDLVVSKLSPTGDQLRASTFLGGTGTDGLVLSGNSRGPLAHNYGDQFRGDVITDGANNVYLASVTSSTDFPLAAGSIQSRNGGGDSDAIVCKLSADLKTLEWSTYLGGSGTDAAYSIQLTPQREVYVGGGTTSTNFPATTGSYRPTHPAGDVEGFVAHLNSAGTKLEQATYLGTSDYDQVYFVQLDAASNVYVLGQTTGLYPATTGLYATATGNHFVHKLNATLSQSLYSTRFGGGGNTEPNLSLTAFLVDDCERIYVCGWGGSVNAAFSGGSTLGLPITPNALQTSTDGSDFYLAQFAAGMKGLEYATYFGERGGRGEHVDGGTSRFDKRGLVYQAVCGGCTGTSGFPTLPNASFSTRNNSRNCNNAAFKIDFGVVLADPGPNRYVCVSAGPVTLGGTPAGGTWSGPGVSQTSAGSYQFTPSPALLGANILTYSVASTGICVSTRALRMTVTPELKPTFAAIPDQCVNTTTPLQLSASPAGGTFTGPGVSGSTFTPSLAQTGTHTLTYSFPNDTTRCGSVTQTVVVNPLPIVEAGPELTFCAYEQQPVQLTGASPTGGVWSGPGVSTTGLFTPPNTNNRGAILTLTYTVVEKGCPNSDTRRIVLAPAPESNVALSIPVCEAAPQYSGLAPFTATFEPILPGGTYQWSFGDGSSSSESNPTHRYEQPGLYQVQLTARYANCVVVTQFAPVVVGEVFIPNIITPNDDPEQLNEQFVPRFSCQPASLQIFNRWGTKVYETATYRNDWRGENLPDGVYYYFLRDQAGRSAKGWVEVKR